MREDPEHQRDLAVCLLQGLDPEACPLPVINVPAGLNKHEERFGNHHVRPAARHPRADLDASIDFHSRPFNATPAKRRPGYANLAIAEPPLKLVLLEGTTGEETRMDHLGVEVETTDLVTAATDRLAAAGLATKVEDNTTCCYAVQDKV